MLKVLSEVLFHQVVKQIFMENLLIVAVSRGSLSSIQIFSLLFSFLLH